MLNMCCSTTFNICATFLLMGKWDSLQGDWCDASPPPNFEFRHQNGVQNLWWICTHLCKNFLASVLILFPSNAQFFWERLAKRCPLPHFEFRHEHDVNFQVIRNFLGTNWGNSAIHKTMWSNHTPRCTRSSEIKYSAVYRHVSVNRAYENTSQRHMLILPENNVHLSKTIGFSTNKRKMCQRIIFGPTTES